MRALRLGLRPQEMERGASVQEQLTDLQSKHKDLQNQLAVASRRADALQDEMSHSLREAKQAMEQNVALKVSGWSTYTVTTLQAL